MVSWFFKLFQYFSIFLELNKKCSTNFPFVYWYSNRVLKWNYRHCIYTFLILQLTTPLGQLLNIQVPWFGPYKRNKEKNGESEVCHVSIKSLIYTSKNSSRRRKSMLKDSSIFQIWNNMSTWGVVLMYSTLVWVNQSKVLKSKNTVKLHHLKNSLIKQH